MGVHCTAFRDTPANQHNIYRRISGQYADELDAIHRRYPTFYVIGEIYGRGVQDLHYDSREHEPRLLFDVYVGEPSPGRYLN